MATRILKNKTLIVLLFAGSIALSPSSDAQRASNSILVNFGRQNCTDSFFGSDITLFSAAQTASPSLVLQCNTTDAFDNVYSKYISYNSVNNKLYINDISDGVNSNMYILNIGTPSNVSCPADTLSYTIPDVILNQFEFDPFGDLYALSDYDEYVGTANIGAYDDTTGLLHAGSLKAIAFPPDNFPTDVGNGDVAILPNGRMFCVFGGISGKLYEITNYKKTDTGDAITTYLGSTSNPCYGIAFDNGYLLMGGAGGGCYSYTYDITNQILSDVLGSPFDSMPIDNTSITPSVAVGEKLISSFQVDATHYDLTYHIYVKNLGNVKLGKVQLIEDLATVFGAGNISNVSTSFVTNSAALDLNTLYNGESVTTLLGGLDQMVNYPVTRTTSIIALKVTVADPIDAYVYEVSAKFSGRIGKDSTLLTLLDSSNNYSSLFSTWDDVLDPNKNDVADDPGEGIPTPWLTGTLMPIELSAFDVHAENTGALLNWSTLSEKNNSYFAIERSSDAVHFDSIGIVSGAGMSAVEHHYSFFDTKLPKQTVYYRLKDVSSAGLHAYSEVRTLELQSDVTSVVVKYSIYPNPASDHLVIESSESSKNELNVDIYSSCGALIFNKSLPGTSLRQQIALPQLPNGLYTVAIKNPACAARFFKISINN